MAKYKYHTSHSYKTKDGTKISFQTQLYQVGVYGITNNDPSIQGNYMPGQIVSIENRLKKQEAAGNITDLVFGREITVSNDTGLWKEVE